MPEKLALGLKKNGTGEFIAEVLVSNTEFQSFVSNTNQRFDNLIGNAHSTLDTLQELSQALANDASFLSNTNAFITNVQQTERAALANTNARFANLTSRVVTLESSGGGGGTGDVSNTYLQLYIANTNARFEGLGTGEVSNAQFQSFVANTNQYIASQLANTNTRIDSVVAGASGVSNTYLQAFIANTNTRITNEGILNGIIGGSNIQLSYSNNKLMILAVPQIDNGFITNDFGSLTDSVEETRDFGDLSGRNV